MSIEYLGLSEINGPMIVIEGVEGAFYDEIVEFRVEESVQRNSAGSMQKRNLLCRTAICDRNRSKTSI